MKIPFLTNSGYNCATVGSITQKIFVCDMNFCYKNVSKIRNVTFISKNFQSILKNVTKIEKTHMESEKSLNLFKIKKGIDHRIIYGTIFFGKFSIFILQNICF